MTKRSDKHTTEERLQRKLAKAQAVLQDAQEQRVHAMNKGEQDVEQARLRAERRVTKATIRVERRSADIARLELELQTLRAGQPREDAHELQHVTAAAAQENGSTEQPESETV